MKLITKFYQLNFYIDLSIIENEIELADEFITEMKVNYSKDENFIKEMDNAKELIELKKLEFLDITCDLNKIKVNSSKIKGYSSKSRSKRWFTPKLRDELQIMKNFVDKLSEKIWEYEKDFKDTKNITQSEFDDITKTIAKQALHTKIVKIEEMIEAIITTQVQNRLNNYLVSLETFDSTLASFMIENSIDHDVEELPYDSNHKYYQMIKAKHEVNQVNIEFRVLNPDL